MDLGVYDTYYWHCHLSNVRMDLGVYDTYYWHCHLSNVRMDLGVYYDTYYWCYYLALSPVQCENGSRGV